MDFVKDAAACRTNFGRIPHADVRFPHLQLFPKLAAELLKAGRLLGSSSDARYAIFTKPPEIHLGMVHYTTEIDPWFHTAAAYNFPTAAALLDWMPAGVRIVCMQKARQSPDTPRNLKEQYLKCYQVICAELQANPAHMTMTRMAAFEASFRTDCASANLATTFDNKKHVRTFKATTAPSSDIDQQVLETNLKILEMGKLLESHVFVLPLSSRVCGVLKRAILSSIALRRLLLLSRKCVTIWLLRRSSATMKVTARVMI